MTVTGGLAVGSYPLVIRGNFTGLAEPHGERHGAERERQRDSGDQSAVGVTGASEL